MLPFASLGTPLSQLVLAPLVVRVSRCSSCSPGGSLALSALPWSLGSSGAAGPSGLSWWDQQVAPSSRAHSGRVREAAATLPQELVSKLLHLHFKDDKTKVSGDALQLTAELLKVFVVEAAVRSVRQAQAEDLTRVDVDQLEKVLPQLLLDF
uniref:Centromere protein X n=1 Tax=Sus scrofa TaxID=9823 RepID=A0A8D1DS03_PIG